MDTVMVMASHRPPPIEVTVLPTTEAPTGPPPGNRLLSELTTWREPLRLLARGRRLRRAPRGDGRLTVDVPGWLAGQTSTAPLRSYLRSLGHDARPWGLGRNGSDVELTVDRFEVELASMVERAGGRPARLVGWSLGGVVAREVARRRPDLVDRLVTFGTPAQGGPTYTIGATRFGAEECARIEALQLEANRDDPLRIPLTAIYTRADAVVDWRACIDPYALDARHLEVRSSHVGLGVDPDVWELVARALAAAPTRNDASPLAWA